MFTNKGRNLQAKAQTGVQLKFTKIALGDGQLAGSAIADLTKLKNLVLNIPIERLRTLSGGRAEVAGILSNQSLNSGFYYRELGLFAMDPQEGEILFCYGNAGNLADYIPASGGPDVIERQIVIQTIVGNATNITAVIDSSLVYATVSDMNLSLQQNLEASKEYTNTEINTIELAIESLETQLGQLTNLETAQKTNLVAAINELKQALVTHLAEDASTSKKGHVQLSDATNSTSTILAATANAVKKVWDMATAKYSKPANGIPKTDLDTTVQASLGKADKSIQESMRNVANGVAGLNALGQVINADGTTAGGISGSYVGTGVDSRFIALPSQPKLVFLWGLMTNGVYKRFSIMGANQEGMLTLYGGGSAEYRYIENTAGNPKRGIDGNGFYVSAYGDTSGNTKDAGYKYMALY